MSVPIPIPFHIRHANSTSDDAQFIMAAFDSTLPHLAAIGAGAMWGEKPFSEKDGFEEETVQSIRHSESPEESLKIFIAEVDGPNMAQRVRVGSAMVREDSLPSYISDREEMKTRVESARNFLFLEVVIVDYRTGALRKGAGAALIEAVKQYGRERGKTMLYVDCWAGNDEKLNRYYENLGFIKVGDFSFSRASGEIWPGTLFRMEL